MVLDPDVLRREREEQLRQSANLRHRLEAVETYLFPDALNDISRWNSLYIDYHPPIVYRLFMNIPNGYRIMLHEVLPCEAHEALYHPHPWPSIVHVVNGDTYEMGVGSQTKVDMISLITREFLYTMTDPTSWHYVAPHGPSYSVMLTGPRWPDPPDAAHAERKALGPLTDKKAKDLLDHFRAIFLLR